MNEPKLEPMTPEERLRAYENLQKLLRAHQEGGPDAMDRTWDELFGKPSIEKAKVGDPAQS